MSEVRGKCGFCLYQCCQPNCATCAQCYIYPEKPNWVASECGGIALRLESDLASAQADAEHWRALERMADELLPSWCIGCQMNHPDGKFMVYCSDCGPFHGETLADAFDAMRADIRAALDKPLDQEVKPGDA